MKRAPGVRSGPSAPVGGTETIRGRCSAQFEASKSHELGKAPAGILCRGLRNPVEHLPLHTYFVRHSPSRGTRNLPRICGLRIGCVAVQLRPPSSIMPKVLDARLLADSHLLNIGKLPAISRAALFPPGTMRLSSRLSQIRTSVCGGSQCPPPKRLPSCQSRRQRAT